MRNTLKASTLPELLVTMIITGIVFLSIMDGLTLFSRLQIQRVLALTANSRFAEGYYRLENLIGEADSIDGTADLNLWRGGKPTMLTLRDSALVLLRGEFSDTLLIGVAALERHKSGFGTDTVAVGIQGSEAFTIRFAVHPPVAERYRMTIDSIEQGYGYDDD